MFQVKKTCDFMSGEMWIEQVLLIDKTFNQVYLLFPVNVIM